MDHIKLGYAPTRRSIFSAPDAIKYRGLTADRLKELGIDFVDITDMKTGSRSPRNLKQRRSTAWSFLTVISEPSMNAHVLPRI